MIKKTTHFLIFICFLLIFIQCAYWRKPFKLQRQTYFGNLMRMDGIYYSKQGYGVFFYKNGVTVGGDAKSRNLEHELDFWERNGDEKHMLSPTIWGIFHIDSNKILNERWLGGNAGSRAETHIFRGEIKNDTTIILESLPNYMMDTFHFHHIEIKPDSTNRFIK